MRALAWLESIATPLADAAVRGAVVFLLAALITLALRRRSAAVRHAVWAGAIMIQLLLPVFGALGPRWSIATPQELESFLPAAPAVTTTARTERTTSPAAVASSPIVERASSHTPEPRPSAVERPAAPIAESAAPSVGGRTILLVLWASGTLVILLRLGAGTLIVAALARRGARVDDGGWLTMTQRLATSLGITRPLTLLRGDRIGVPVTWGIVYPIVLLPEGADTWPEERRRFVLVHEMAHVKRLDALTQLVGQIALALFWFDPLVWIANRRMQLEREHACDDYVLRHGTSATLYAEELLAMVRALGTSRHRSTQPAFAALAMARRSEFEGRMLSILDPVQNRLPLGGVRAFVVALAALLLAIPLAALRPYRAAVTSPQLLAPGAGDEPAGVADAVLPESFKVTLAPVSSKARTSASTAVEATTPGSTAIAPSTAKALSTMSCDPVRFSPPPSAQRLSRTHDDGRTTTFEYLDIDPRRCVQAVIVGKVRYTEAEDDIVSMAEGAHAYFRERTADGDRGIAVRRADDGSLERVFRVDGAVAPYDDTARRWLGTLLPAILREAVINVGPRVAHWRAEGGVDRALAMIGTMKSPSAMKAHYVALIDGGPLSTDEADRVMRQASRDLRGSSTDLRTALAKLAPRVRNLARASTALEDAVLAIPGSSDRLAVLREFGDTEDRAMLLSVARMSESVPGSSDRTLLLESLMPRYLVPRDSALRSAYFHAVGTIPSSTDMRRVLNGVVAEYAGHDDDVARRVIDAARAIDGSTDRSAVLVQLAEVGALRNPATRDAAIDAARGLGSTDMARVLQAIARR